MSANAFDLAFVDDVDVPDPQAGDHVLVRWLRLRLGRAPTWLEVLALRRALRERARRRVRWAWWRRLRRPTLTRTNDLVADFLQSWEGQVLLRLLGSMVELRGAAGVTKPLGGI